MQSTPTTIANHMSVATVANARGVTVLHGDIMTLGMREKNDTNLMIPVSEAVFTQTTSRSQTTRITPIKHTILFEHILTPVKRRILLFQMVHIHIKGKIRRHSAHQRLPHFIHSIPLPPQWRRHVLSEY